MRILLVRNKSTYGPYRNKNIGKHREQPKFALSPLLNPRYYHRSRLELFQISCLILGHSEVPDHDHRLFCPVFGTDIVIVIDCKICYFFYNQTVSEVILSLPPRINQNQDNSSIYI